MKRTSHQILVALLMASFSTGGAAVECGNPAVAGAAPSTNKPHVNVVVLGGSGQAKTMLTAANTKHQSSRGLARYVPLEKILEFPEDGDRETLARFLLSEEARSAAEQGKRMRLRRSVVNYASEKHHYAHVDAPEFSDYVKGLIIGSWAADGAVLVVSTADDLQRNADRQIRLLREAQVPCAVVFLESAADGAEAAIRRLLSQHGYPGQDVPVIRGSSLKALRGEDTAAIDELLRAMDRYIPPAASLVDEPFMMPVEDVFTVAGRGTVVTGKIARGIVKENDEIEIVGLRATARTTCSGVEIMKKRLDEGRAGDNVQVYLRGTQQKDVERGQVLAKPGSIKPCKKFSAVVYLLTAAEGGRERPFFGGYRPQFYFRTTDVTGLVTLPPGVQQVRPGDSAKLTIKLTESVALERRLRFAVREGGQTVGAGMVGDLLQCSD